MSVMEFLSNISSLTFTLECNLVHGTNCRQYIGTTSVILVFYVVSHIHKKSFFINSFIFIARVREIEKSEYQLRHVRLSVRPSIRIEQLGSH